MFSTACDNAFLSAVVFRCQKPGGAQPQANETDLSNCIYDYRIMFQKTKSFLQKTRGIIMLICTDELDNIVLNFDLIVRLF